jgi:hypothetical protein
MRRTMSDGGEVYSGPLARRALRALGARAMTMDHTILVDDDFDESNPEDQALYAHERFHQMESGGADHSDDLHDAEEMGAQAVERMVLHRAHAGEDFGDIMRDVKSGGGTVNSPETSNSHIPASGGPAEQLSTEQKAYMALRKQGKSHHMIVDELARHVVKSMAKQEESAPNRSGSSRW